MKGRSFIGIAAAIGAGAFAIATVALAGPAMSTRWSEMTLTEEECIEKGRRSVRAAGFTKNFEVVSTTIFGERGDYTAGVRCAVEKEEGFSK